MTFVFAQKLPSRTVCSTCGMKFSSRNKLFTHMRSVSHGQNRVQNVLLVQLQELLGILLNGPPSKKTKCGLFVKEPKLRSAGCRLQKIVNMVSRLQPQEARAIARMRADNGATILHFLLDIRAAWPKYGFRVVGDSNVPQALLKKLVSWTICSSEITTPVQKKVAKQWSGPCQNQRGEYCWYSTPYPTDGIYIRPSYPQSTRPTEVASFRLCTDTCWVYHTCRPGESAFQVAMRLINTGTRLIGT